MVLGYLVVLPDPKIKKIRTYHYSLFFPQIFQNFSDQNQLKILQINLLEVQLDLADLSRLSFLVLQELQGGHWLLNIHAHRNLQSHPK